MLSDGRKIQSDTILLRCSIFGDSTMPNGPRSFMRKRAWTRRRYGQELLKGRREKESACERERSLVTGNRLSVCPDLSPIKHCRHTGQNEVLYIIYVYRKF